MNTKNQINLHFIKPFNHTPSSSFFRLACIVDFMDESKLLSDAVNAQKALNQLKNYANSLKGKTRKRVRTVRGRRISLERIVRSPLKKIHSQILYGIAVEIEKILERHYQIKSGETYVVLSKASSQMYETVSARVASISVPTAIMKGEIKNEQC